MVFVPAGLPAPLSASGVGTIASRMPSCQDLRFDGDISLPVSLFLIAVEARAVDQTRNPACVRSVKAGKEIGRFGFWLEPPESPPSPMPAFWWGSPAAMDCGEDPSCRPSVPPRQGDRRPRRQLSATSPQLGRLSRAVPTRNARIRAGSPPQFTAAGFPPSWTARDSRDAPAHRAISQGPGPAASECTGRAGSRQVHVQRASGSSPPSDRHRR